MIKLILNILYTIFLLKMDIQKYRKWYLEENWGQNRFTMIKYTTRVRQLCPQDTWQHRVCNRWNHPLVNVGKAFWINNRELCVGYELSENSEIFRPIFSHKRQRLLDRMHKFTLLFDENGEKTNEDEEGYTIDNPYKFWNKIKSKYFKEIYKIKKIPVECINYIVNFIY